MLRELLNSWSGAVTINEQTFNNAENALNSFNFDTLLLNKIVLHSESENVNKGSFSQPESIVYKITVKQYMTKPTTSPDFDFMERWNNNNPMPMRIMVGTIEKETAGMVYMKLHADIIGQTQDFCMKCGKPITNPVSKYFGMGPECGQHGYVNPFNSDEELKAAVEEYKKNYLAKIKWEGWIIKSAIIFQEVVE